MKAANKLRLDISDLLNEPRTDYPSETTNLVIRCVDPVKEKACLHLAQLRAVFVAAVPLVVCRDKLTEALRSDKTYTP